MSWPQYPVPRFKIFNRYIVMKLVDIIDTPARCNKLTKAEQSAVREAALEYLATLLVQP